MLEVEIADLIKNTKFNVSGQSDDWAGQRPAWEEAGPSQQLDGVNSEADERTAGTRVDLNEPSYERPAWDSDIKIYDPEKLANVASSAAQVRRRVIIVGVLSMTLGIAWLGRSNSDQFVRAIGSALPVEHKVASLGSSQPISTVPPSALDAPQEAMPGVRTDGKIGKLPASGSGNQRDPTQNVAPSFAAEKRAAVVSQNTAAASTSTSTSTTIHRRPKTSQVPFPETKPTTIDGWAVREVANGTAVLQGPNGVWKAARGDTVPGLGTVDSVVLWGSRWIVSTSRGLITTR